MEIKTKIEGLIKRNAKIENFGLNRQRDFKIKAKSALRSTKIQDGEAANR